MKRLNLANPYWRTQPHRLNITSIHMRKYRLSNVECLLPATCREVALLASKNCVRRLKRVSIKSIVRHLPKASLKRKITFRKLINLQKKGALPCLSYEEKLVKVLSLMESSAFLCWLLKASASKSA